MRSPAKTIYFRRVMPTTDLPSTESLLECSSDGMVVVDAEGRLAYANASALALFNLKRCAQDDFLDLVHDDDRERVRGAFYPGESLPLDPLQDSGRVVFRAARAGGNAGSVPGRIIESARCRTPEGCGRSFLVLNLREILSPPSPSWKAGSSEAEVESKNQLLDLIVGHIPAMVCRIDREGNIRETFGSSLTEGDSEGRSALQGWPGARPFVLRALAGERVHFEHEYRKGDRCGTLDVWFSPSLSAEGGVLGFAVDITEKKRTEEELSKSEAFSRRIIESSRDSIMILDTAGNLLSISYSGRKLMEIEDPEDFLSRSWLDFWRGEDRGKAENAVRMATRTGVGKFQGYCPSMTGKPKWWDVIITPILNPEWEPERLLAVCRDISEHKRFEESLRRSKEQLEAILRAISDSVVVTDVTGRVVYANDAAARLLGMGSAQELLDTPLETLAAKFNAIDERGMIYNWPGAQPAPIPKQSAEGRVLRFRNKAEASERWLVVNCATVRDGEGRTHLNITSAYDFTERKQAEDALRKSEEQLRQSQKMEAVGRLAGGVAHDFNNLLTAINGYSELMARSLTEQDPLQSTIGEIRRAGERAASLTRQLLTFSRRQVLASRILDLNQVVGEIRTMLSRLIGEDIHLVTLADPAHAKVKADPGQMEQVILNLALNARDAMPTGGTLTIEAVHARLDKGDPGLYFPVEPGRYVRLTVSDTGIGMDDNVKGHLFEPFFTTKPQGQGTGLGLSTVYGIVKQAGGNISVRSEPGLGTAFVIYLPASDGAREEEAGKSPEKAVPIIRCRETVLLVEDEDMVRRLIAQVLAGQGYTVLEAGSGPMALELVDRHAGTIDLLLTDVVMAGMSGRELSEKLLLLRPDLKVLYMSGYTDDAILRHGVLQNSTAFLGKPFSPGTLVRKLREVLENLDPDELAAAGSGRTRLTSAPE